VPANQSHVALHADAFACCRVPCRAVLAVGVITVAVTAWLCLASRQRPHQLEAPQLDAFRAATAAAAAASSSAGDAAGAAAGAAAAGSGDGAPAGTTCPICLSDVAMAVQSNCGHWYCGGCIVGYWRHSARSGGQLRCPCCRRGISLLHSALSVAEVGSEAGAELLDSIGQYNRRHGGLPISFADRVRDAPTLLWWLLEELFSPRGTALLLALHFSLPAVGSVLGMVCYVLSPVDLLPDWSVVGLADDVVVSLLLLIFISSLYRAHHTGLGDGGGSGSDNDGGSGGSGRRRRAHLD
jgi:RING finger protein 170